MVDDFLIHKAATIERAVRRVREMHGGDDDGLAASLTRLEAVILNLQRACEGSVDLAMHLVRVHRLGVPQETREAFELLERARLIDEDLADRLKKMVAFRNAAIHDSDTLTPDMVRGVVADVDDFLAFTEHVLRGQGRGSAG